MASSSNDQENSESVEGLKCWYTNAGSLDEEKLDELRLLIASLPPDIIFITETWFKQKTVFELEGYECIRKDRILNDTVTKGGGVCIYLRKNWDCQKKDFDTIATTITPTNVEQVWCKLSIPNKDQSSATILSGCIYRPLKIDISRDIAINNIIMKSGEIIRKETNEYSGIILAGDFNYNSDDMQWEYDAEQKKM